MKVIIIGNSGHWAYALEELKNHTVSGICPGFEGEDVSTVVSALKEKGISAPVGRFDEMIGQADIAIINTRFDLNGEYTLKCLEKNIYVFSEKPLALTEEQLEKIENAKTDAFVSAMFGITYEPWCLTVKKHMGEIGEVRMLNARKSYKLGIRPEFYKNKSTFGGIIPWVAIHALHWIYFTTGLEFCETLSVADNSFNNGNGDLETAAAAIMKMSNGSIATVTADYYRPSGAKTHDDDRLRIVGTRGVIEYEKGKVTLINESGERELPLENGQDIFKLFVDRINDGKSGISQEESIYITRTALKLDEKAR